MPNSSEVLDALFRALADPTRRAVLEQLGGGPKSTSELARPFGMSMPSFMQHLDVLRTGGLVRSRKVGRIRVYEAVGPPLDVARRWIEKRRAAWSRRLDQLDRYLETMKESP